MNWLLIWLNQYQVDKWDWHRLNGNVAIWSREKDSISDEEYQKFFKVISKEPSDAQTWIHFKAEVGVIHWRSVYTMLTIIYLCRERSSSNLSCMFPRKPTTCTITTMTARPASGCMSAKCWFKRTLKTCCRSIWTSSRVSVSAAVHCNSIPLSHYETPVMR